MIKVHNRPRGSGKTSEVISRMNVDETIICIVPNIEIKYSLYPKELRDRIIVLGSEGYLGGIQEIKQRGNKILMDEVFRMNPVITMRALYEFGKHGIDVEVFGTY